MKKIVLAAGMSLLMLLSMVACNKGNQEGIDGGASAGTETSEYVYVPEYRPMESPENGWVSDIALVGDKLYYSIYTYDELTGTSTNEFVYRPLSDFETQQKVDLQLSVESENSDVAVYEVDAEGNMYVIWNVYDIPEAEDGEYVYHTYLGKYDSIGTELFLRNLNDIFDDLENVYFNEMAVASSGEVVLCSEQSVYILDKEYNLIKEVPAEVDWIEDMCITQAGKLLYVGYGMNGVGMYEIDIATGAKGTVYKNIPDMGNGGIKDAGNGKLYIAGYSEFFEYDMATQESQTIFKWIDSNIEGNAVRDFSVLEDGRILAFCDNYNSASELTVLTKTPASEVVQKQIITLATLYDGSNLSESVIAFNKKNTKYQIKLKNYIDSNAEWTDTTYEDGLALMYADIISADAPDIIDLSYVDVESLVSKGALEDLTPYLEKSTAANKEDFVESVLNAYNYEGVQVAVPTQFQIIALMGKSEQVGDTPGWTLDEVIALADQNPEAQLLQYTTKEYALTLCMQYNNNSFIDYKTGTCSFNTPEFEKVLEFANRFPQEADYDSDISFPNMIQSGKVLLADVYFHDVQQYQMYQAMFGTDTTCIGYPTMDGSAGIFLSGQDMCGISASSECKDGAWTFIESMLEKKENSDYRWMYSSRKDELENMFAEAMKPEYQYDENGEIMYDEDGNPLEYPKTTWGYDDWETEIYAATQEDVDAIRNMINIARPQRSAEQTIMKIIMEEASSYFKGQKSAQDVANIIQSRVEVYVSENY